MITNMVADNGTSTQASAAYDAELKADDSFAFPKLVSETAVEQQTHLHKDKALKLITFEYTNVHQTQAQAKAVKQFAQVTTA